MYRRIKLDTADAIDCKYSLQRKALRLDEWLARMYTLSSCEVSIEPLYIYIENNSKYAIINIYIRQANDWLSVWSEPVKVQILPTVQNKH